jgi:hypothetical protein
VAAITAVIAPAGNAIGTKSRQVIYGSRIAGAKIRAEHARQRAVEAAREADWADAEAWSIRMECYGWLEVECHRCKTRAPRVVRQARPSAQAFDEALGQFALATRAIEPQPSLPPLNNWKYPHVLGRNGSAHLSVTEW